MPEPIVTNPAGRADQVARGHYDVVVVGGGHNGLVAAAYAARAGLSVVVLERLDHTGGAAVSVQPFAGHQARLSRYSYLVSLLPEQLMAELDLSVRLASRSTASYTPWQRGPLRGGLLVERREGPATQQSFRELTGGDEEYAAWQQFYAEMGDFAGVVAPTLMSPLPTEEALRSQVSERLWNEIVCQPLGQTIRSRFTDDTVRGVVATDALIGTFASLDELSLIQNRCFLYHLIGNGTGEWRVPIGGMGAVTDALARSATRFGAELVTGATVTSIQPSAADAEVRWTDGERQHSVTARRVLAGVAPAVLGRLLGEPQLPSVTPVQGSQLKINFLLDRLPALACGADPEVAFAGTLHLSEDYTQLEQAWRSAGAGAMPDPLPGEVYCHSLTDPSILGEGPTGRHTLTYFGLHTPAALFETDPGARELAVQRALASLNAVLAEPIEHCLARDAHGQLCLEAKFPHDLETELAMPGGHIFHGDLHWPWADAGTRLETPAEQWGVQTHHPTVLLCGSGARRGGAVSGLGGHNAVQAVVAEL